MKHLMTLALGLGLVGAIPLAAAQGPSATVHPGDIADGAVSLRLDDALVSREDGSYRAVVQQGSGAVRVMIDDLAAPTRITCHITPWTIPDHPLSVSEYIADGTQWAATGKVDIHALQSGPVVFIVKPEPSGDYMYELKSDTAHWMLERCTVEAL